MCSSDLRSYRPEHTVCSLLLFCSHHSRSIPFFAGTSAQMHSVISTYRIPLTNRRGSHWGRPMCVFVGGRYFRMISQRSSSLFRKAMNQIFIELDAYIWDDLIIKHIEKTWIKKLSLNRQKDWLNNPKYSNTIPTEKGRIFISQSRNICVWIDSE